MTTAQLNTIFPTVGINPVAVAVLRDAAAKYPANDFTTGDGLNSAGFRFNTPLPAERNSHVGKFDFNLTGKQTAFVRASVIYDLIARERQFPDTPAPTIWSHPMGIAAGHTWTLNNSMVNNFRYGYTREAFSQQGDSAENAISFPFHLFTTYLFPYLNPDNSRSKLYGRFLVGEGKPQLRLWHEHSAGSQSTGFFRQRFR